MVSHRFCEALVERQLNLQYRITILGEEIRPAYDRVNLSKYFEKRNAESLALTGAAWYASNGLRLALGARVDHIDRIAKTVFTADGTAHPYGTLVLATGSAPFVPSIPGIDKKGVFVYRTIEDLEAMCEWAQHAKHAAVIGGGLLGLEAAKAVRDLGLKATVVEFADRLMPRQLDATGSGLLRAAIQGLGVDVRLNHATKSIAGNGSVTGLHFTSNELLEVDMVIVSAGIRPRDELARAAGIEVGERGGVMIDDRLQTSDQNVFAIGEVALHQDMIYGLVAPGYEMAQTLAARLAGEDCAFTGADLSTKLKLLGVDVASFGDPFVDDPTLLSFNYQNPGTGIYKKVVINPATRQIVGGMLVGDADSFGLLAHYARSGEPFAGAPESLLAGVLGAPASAPQIVPDTMQVCSCNDVSKKALCEAIRNGTAATLGELKACTKAGTGCGGCMPEVTRILHQTLKDAGITVKNHLCEHFAHSRQELFEIVRIKRIKTFEELLAAHGQGDGCEVCKPAVASILASLWNEMILEHEALQDTNDRFLANIQRQGTYSIVPRVPGGEITPGKLIAIGAIAKKWALYCKITGGQRIDLLGARVDQLPEIWEELLEAGFESGHAYGKAVRTVKSCVGKTWCRFGVQDSTSFAIRIEERYKGIRAPHKLKFAVSGCLRECAEARSKDVGLIATEKGWNLYICGNGGAKPRHADLLVSDLDEETAIRYIDRFLMYYIRTAGKLARTSTWLEGLEGGLDHVRDVVIQDALGLAEDLEAAMAHLVDTYACEWAEVVKNPELRARFRHFANTPKPDPALAFVPERGQQRPADWPGAPLSHLEGRSEDGLRWVAVGQLAEFPVNGGMAIEYGGAQIAIFNFAARNQWYAVQNACPHRGDQVLARGILGSHEGQPKVACPMHKKTFSLETGACLSGDSIQVQTYPVKILEDRVWLELPPEKAMKKAKPCSGSCNVHAGV
ncbi:MAG: nitrite reductase small subunit NirD [Candidatus Hydrogenedentes bacterium]|nr:nitrite reductase small subunit NirD [Candidatus Hydrogenedentota bacterium]